MKVHLMAEDFSANELQFLREPTCVACSRKPGAMALWLRLKSVSENRVLTQFG